MSVLDAVLETLKKSGSSLHYKKITQLIISEGLWKTSGKTPSATVIARLSVDIKKNGSSSRFKRVAPGTFAANELGPNPTINNLKTAPGKVPTVSFTDAAEQVLERFGNRKPLHYRTITDTALSERLISTAGQTPEATMYAQILTEIQRTVKRGKQPRFMKYGKGYVGLSKWLGKGLAFQIEQHNKETSKKLHKRIRTIAAKDFEK